MHLNFWRRFIKCIILHILHLFTHLCIIYVYEYLTLDFTMIPLAQYDDCPTPYWWQDIFICINDECLYKFTYTYQTILTHQWHNYNIYLYITVNIILNISYIHFVSFNLFNYIYLHAIFHFLPNSFFFFFFFIGLFAYSFIYLLFSIDFCALNTYTYVQYINSRRQAWSYTKWYRSFRSATKFISS